MSIGEVTREALYDEVWADPVTVVAGRYGLSDVGLAKICRKLAIPLPTRGYWAMVKAGRIMKKTALPKLKNSRIETLPLTRLAPDVVEARTEAKVKATSLRKTVREIPVPGELLDPHPLIKATAKRLKQRDDWADPKGLRSAPSEVLNLQVTRGALDRALRITDVLIKALEVQGVEIRVDDAAKATYLIMNETSVSFMVTEHVARSRHEATPAEIKAKERYWNRTRWDSSPSFPSIPDYDYTPTGLLTISAGHWHGRNWRDTAKTSLENRLGEVVAGLFALAEEIRAKQEDERRREEERRRALERYEFLKDRLEQEQKRFKKLEEEAVNLERAMRLRIYADAVEQRAMTCVDGMTKELDDWLAWTRAKADWLDPLIRVSDPILDAPEPKKPGYYWG